jgi:hypothetical protein
MRVEDMFASFDGDDFEAVTTAATRSSEPAAPAAPTAAAAAAKSVHSSSSNSSLDSGDEPGDLYLAVSTRRAAAMAAEAANKQSPKPRRRKAPLGSTASDAWMFPTPAKNVPAVQVQGLSVEQQYEAAQRALLPPLEDAAAAASGIVGVGSKQAVVAAAAVAAEHRDASQQQQQQQQEVVVVVVQRPDTGDRPVTPAPHAAHAQPAGDPQQQLLMAKLSSGSRASLAGMQSDAVAAAVQACPAATAPEGMLGIAGVGAATVATQQLRLGEARNFNSSRVLSAAPVLLAPLAAATAEMVGALSAGGKMVGATEAAAAAEAEARVWLPALPSSDDEEYKQELAVMASAVAVGSAGISKTRMYNGDEVEDAVPGYGAAAVANRRPRGAAALRRALCKLRFSVVVSNTTGSNGSSSSSY